MGIATEWNVIDAEVAISNVDELLRARWSREADHGGRAVNTLDWWLQHGPAQSSFYPSDTWKIQEIMK